MTDEIDATLKKEIFRLIQMPGVEIEDIAKKLNLDYHEVMDFLSNEYLRSNLDYGRRLCCRF